MIDRASATARGLESRGHLPRARGHAQRHLAITPRLLHRDQRAVGAVVAGGGHFVAAAAIVRAGRLTSARDVRRSIGKRLRDDKRMDEAQVAHNLAAAFPVGIMDRSAWPAQELHGPRERIAAAAPGAVHEQSALACVDLHAGDRRRVASGEDELAAAEGRKSVNLWVSKRRARCAMGSKAGVDPRGGSERSRPCVRTGAAPPMRQPRPQRPR